MRWKQKAAPLVAAALTAGMGLAYAGTSGADVPAQQSDVVCNESGDGWQEKIDTPGGGPATVSAPPGYLITAYCAKGGADKEIVTVDPPQETVTIGAENLSHYQIKLCWLGPDGGDPTNSLNAPECPEEPPPPTTTTTAPPTTLTPEPAGAVAATPQFTG